MNPSTTHNIETSVDIQSLPSSSSTTQPSSVGQKRSNPSTAQKAKRARYSKPTARHGGASYNKQTMSPSTTIRPVQAIFPVFTSDEGCTVLTEHVHAWLSGRDYRFGNQVPLFLMQYVVSILFQARLLWVSMELGYHLDRDTSYFKSCCKSILIPDVLAQYIETLGFIDTASGHRVAPAAYPWHVVRDSIHSRRLIELYRQFDADGEIPDRCLRPDLLLRYSHVAARGTRMGVGFRAVNFDNPQGRRELLASVKSDPRGIIPCAPSAITVAEAQLGAIHHWRRIEEQDDWLPAENHLLHADFEDTVVNPGLFVSGIMGERHQGSDTRF